MTPKVANLILGFFLLQTTAIGLLPLFFGYDGLAICSIGSLSYGLYAFMLPSRMIARLKPRVSPNSPAEHCILDLIRAWALFCAALGAMGLVVLEGNQRTTAMRQFDLFGGWVGFLCLGLASHEIQALGRRKAFLMVNMAANTAICICRRYRIAAAGGFFIMKETKMETGEPSKLLPFSKYITAR